MSGDFSPIGNAERQRNPKLAQCQPIFHLPKHKKVDFDDNCQFCQLPAEKEMLSVRKNATQVSGRLHSFHQPTTEQRPLQEGRYLCDRFLSEDLPWVLWLP